MTRPSRSKQTKSRSLRLASLFCALMVGFGLIAGRLIWLQIMAGERLTALAQGQRQRKVALAPQRGSILDRSGAELAISIDMKTVFANPRFVNDPQAAAQAMAPLLHMPAAELAEKLSRPSGFVYVARKIAPEAAAKVEALNLPGVGVVSESKREYPAGRLASHVLGFVGFENKGLGGLELQYEKTLAGLPGEILTERDPEGRPIPMGESAVKPARPGEDLILTIDSQIQFNAETELAKAVEAYRAKGGSVVVMDPSNGDILAMANFPSFDPNHVGETSPSDLRNKAVQEVYEPGSPNKVITAAAAIESGVAKPTDTLSVPATMQLGSKRFKDSHPHPTQTLSFSEIIQRSSNIGTIKVALNLGKHRLFDYLTRFGYGKTTGLGFPGEASGILPKPEKWWGSSIGTIPIGQGVAATPLQVMSVFSALANEGVMAQPRLVRAKIDSAGRRRPARVAPSRKVVEPETARTLTEMLVGVTQGQEGTGRVGAIPGYRIAAKTGTAQKPSRTGYSGYVASFYGYAPAEDPKLVVGVVLDEPTPIYGGLTAAVAFQKITHFSLRRLGIGPGPVLPLEGTPLPAPARSGGVALNT